MAFDAVRFALAYSTQQCGETMMAKRVRGKLSATGIVLAGVVGAGQSGMIRMKMGAPGTSPRSNHCTRCSSRSVVLLRKGVLLWQ